MNDTSFELKNVEIFPTIPISEIPVYSHTIIKQLRFSFDVEYVSFDISSIALTVLKTCYFYALSDLMKWNVKPLVLASVLNMLNFSQIYLHVYLCYAPITPVRALVPILDFVQIVR